MKTVQKLEIASGLATFVSTFAYFCVYMLPFAKFKYENYGAADFAIVLVGSFLTFLAPSALAATAAYVWAVRASSLAFGAVIVGASITAFIDFLLVVGVRFYSREPLTTLLILLPLIFPILTVIFVFWCRKAFPASR